MFLASQNQQSLNPLSAKNAVADIRSEKKQSLLFRKSGTCRNKGSNQNFESTGNYLMFARKDSDRRKSDLH